MTDLPAPLVPAEVDLTDFGFMPLDVRRLRDSRIASRATGDEFRAAVLLWCAAWHQKPAGSLPNDEVELATLSGYGRVAKEWKKVRAGALHGWIACSDGRLYHQVVSEKANESWRSKMEHAWRKECDRLRKENKRLDGQKLPVIGIPSFDEWNSARQHSTVPAETIRVSGGIPEEKALKGEVRDRDRDREHKGQGDSLKPSKVKPVPTEPSASAASGSAAWIAFTSAYEKRYGVTPVRNAKVNSQFLQLVQRLGADESPSVAAFYVLHNRGLYVSAKHPADLLLRDAEGLRTEWAMGRTVTDTEARQADRTQAIGNVFQPLIEEARERERIANGGK